MNSIKALGLAAVFALSAGAALAESNSVFESLAESHVASIVTVSSGSDNQLLFASGAMEPVDIDALQARVGQNMWILSQLENAGYDASNVIGIDANGGNDVTLYVRG